MQAKKTTLAVLAAVLSIPSICLGHLIDLTPGGFQGSDPFPEVFNQWLQNTPRKYQFLDSMSAVPYTLFGVTYPAGWVSQFGALDGGTYFFCHIDQTGPVPQTIISWDFTGTDFFLRNVLVTGDATNLYGVSWLERIKGEGTIVADGVGNIFDVAFYGNIPGQSVPDSGTTLSLFVVGLVGLCAFRKNIRRLKW